MNSHLKNLIDDLGDLTLAKIKHDEQLKELNQKIEQIESKIKGEGLEEGTYVTGKYCCAISQKTVRSPKSTSWKNVATHVFGQFPLIESTLEKKFPEAEKALKTFESKLTKAYNDSYEVNTKDGSESVKTIVTVTTITK